MSMAEGGVTITRETAARRVSATRAGLAGGLCWSVGAVALLAIGGSTDAALAVAVAGTVSAGLAARWAVTASEAPGAGEGLHLLDPGPVVLDAELERARRLGTTLAVVGFSTGGGRSGSTPGSPVALHPVVEQRLRAIDGVWVARGMIFAALPATDRAGAFRCVERVREAAALTSASVAVFPDDGLTSSAILDHLASNSIEDGVLIDLTERPAAPERAVEAAEPALP